MKVQLAAELASLRGGTKNGGFVYFIRKGLMFARSKALSISNPQSTDQTAIRSFVTAITKNWKALTENQRIGFFDYIEAYYPNRNPLAQFVSQNLHLAIHGDSYISDAATTTAPAFPDAVSGVAAADADHTVLYIDHSIPSGDVGNYHIEVRQTAPMVSLARKPRFSELRFVKGVGVASTSTLLATGSSHPYTYASIAHPVDNGQRYGIGVKIVETATGLVSKEIMWEGIKTFA